MADRRTTQSRYQAGLSYDPALAAGSYRPERTVRPQTPIGDYSVAPIPLPTSDGGGVTPPLATQGGSGLGGVAGFGGLGALSLLSPSNLNALRNLYNRATNGTQTGDASSWGSQPESDFSTFGSQPDGSVAATGADVANDTADKAAGVLGDAGMGTWQEGVLGSGDGSGGLFGYGGMSAFPYGSDAVPWEGLLGSADLGALGSLDISSAGLGVVGGALGNYMVRQSNYNGSRDPAGRDIGAAIGSAIGGIIGGPVAPITAFLGAQFGGMIGGQFGPQLTAGPTAETALHARNGDWGISSTAAHGAQPINDLGGAFQNAVNALIAARGYEYVPGAENYTVVGWNAGGDGTRMQRGGYYIRPNPYQGEEELLRVYFGNSLNDPYVSYGAQMRNSAQPGSAAENWNSYLPTPQFGLDANLGGDFPLDMSFLAAPQGMSVGDAMASYLFNDMAYNGSIRPIGGEARQVPLFNGTPGEQSVG